MQRRNFLGGLLGVMGLWPLFRRGEKERVITVSIAHIFRQAADGVVEPLYRSGVEVHPGEWVRFREYEVLRKDGMLSESFACSGIATSTGVIDEPRCRGMMTIAYKPISLDEFWAEARRRQAKREEKPNATT